LIKIQDFGGGQWLDFSSFIVAAGKTVGSQPQRHGESRGKIEQFTSIDARKTREHAMLTNRTRSRKQVSPKNRPDQPQPPGYTRRTLRMESLESRSLMAADLMAAHLTSGVLTIEGTSGNDQIEVTENSGTGGWYGGPSSQLRVTVTNRDTNQVVSSQLFNKDAVKDLIIDGGAGNDVIVNKTEKSSIIYAGDGNDTVQSGAASDHVFQAETIKGTDSADWDGGEPYWESYVHDGVLVVNGNWGDDMISVNEAPVTRGDGWGTANMLRVTRETNLDGPGYTRLFDKSQVRHIVFQGAHGNDNLYNSTNLPATMFGGAGLDLLVGGSATDLIFGGADVDELHGGAGDDLLEGGDARDFLYGEAGSDTLDGGAGDDYLWGGFNPYYDPIEDNATDFLVGGTGRDTFYLPRKETGTAISDVFADMAPEDYMLWTKPLR
jgi:Ca2+-binding RTX toxin-like protein